MLFATNPRLLPMSTHALAHPLPRDEYNTTGTKRATDSHLSGEGYRKYRLDAGQLVHPGNVQRASVNEHDDERELGRAMCERLNEV